MTPPPALTWAARTTRGDAMANVAILWFRQTMQGFVSLESSRSYLSGCSIFMCSVIPNGIFLFRRSGNFTILLSVSVFHREPNGESTALGNVLNNATPVTAIAAGDLVMGECVMSYSHVCIALCSLSISACVDASSFVQLGFHNVVAQEHLRSQNICPLLRSVCFSITVTCIR